MKKVLSIVGISLVTLFSFISPVLADSSVAYGELVDAMNKEVDEIYVPYYDLQERLNTEEDMTSAISDFMTGLTTWNSVYRSTGAVYAKYTDSEDSKIKEIAVLANESITSGKEALSLYTEAFSKLEDPTADVEAIFAEADQNFSDAVEKHDQAIDLYNEYSGVNSSFDFRNVLIGATVVLAVISGILFLKSRTNSTLESAIIKANVYRNLFLGTIGMTAGLGITAATYAWALNNGGSYFIFYGPVIAGLLNFVKQIAWYLKVGRKQIKDVKEKENGTAVQGVYLEAPTAVK